MKKIILFCFLNSSMVLFAINNAPVAVDDTIYYTYAEVHQNDTFKINADFRFNDYDPDGHNFKVIEILYSGSNALVAFNPQGAVLWVDFVPLPNFSGNDSFQYVIQDNGSPAKKDTGTVFFTVMRKGYAQLEVNNIKATIRKDVLFAAPANSGPGYETPIGSGIHSIYSSNIWMTGSNNGMVFTNIREFGGHIYQDVQASNNGPVSNTSHTDSLFNTNWDRVWEVWKVQIDNHISHWSDQGYLASDAILEWPAHGNVVKGEAQYLAPFFDNNQDGTYNPYDGDYPIIKGDQSIYFIYNDGNSPTSLNPMFSEVHGMAYAYSCQDSALQNTIFVDYKIYNRSNTTYDSTYIGMWSDMDVGNAMDDFVQCDVMRNMFFMYNGDDFDDANSGRPGYEDHPASQAVVILKGARKDSDNSDNNFGIQDDESVNGTGFGDGISDNEFWGLSGFVFYNNGGSVIGGPRVELDYHNYLRGIWKDGTSFNYGGVGYPYTGTPIQSTRYIFPDTSDLYYYGTGGDTVPVWSEISEGNVPNDRRGVGATGPFTFASGESIELTYAFVTGRDYVNTGSQAGVTNMLARVDSIQSYYDQGMLGACGFPLSVKEPVTVQNDLLIYPNPTKDILRIKLKKAQTVHVEVIDVSGKVMLSTTGLSELIVLDLSSLTNGLYVVKVTTNSNTFVEKVIKK